jgi:hypothetical protein
MYLINESKINAIILSKDIKGDEVLFIDYIEVEITKSGERQVYRFPFESWLRTAKQDKKAEETKARFGKKHCLLAYPNEKPRFEYQVRVGPKLDSSGGDQCEYKIEVDYETKSSSKVEEYLIEFDSRTDEMPKNGKIILRLNGTATDSDVFNFTEKTETADKENKLLFKIKSRDIGDVNYIFHLTMFTKIYNLS